MTDHATPTHAAAPEVLQQTLTTLLGEHARSVTVVRDEVTVVVAAAQTTAPTTPRHRRAMPPKWPAAVVVPTMAPLGSSSGVRIHTPASPSSSASAWLQTASRRAFCSTRFATDRDRSTRRND